MEILWMIEIPAGVHIFRSNKRVLPLLPLCIRQQIKCSHSSPGIELPAFCLDHISRKRISRSEIDKAGGIEIAFLCVIRPLTERNLFDQFRNKKMQVGISLSMRV